MSQNLITNGGFDVRTKCPNRISQISLSAGWHSSGSADLFCNCSPPKSAVYAGLSFVGALLPNSGDCYSGFIVNSRYKEYITFELPQKMKKRTSYCIRFLYARSVFSGIKVDSLGIYLHKKMHKNAVMGQPIYKTTASVAIEDHPGKWTAVSFTFTCNGGERFITIGSFGNDLKKAEYVPPKMNKKNTRIFNYSRSGYYFIEDVEIIQLHNGESCQPESLPTPIVLNKPDDLPLEIDQAIEQTDTLSFTKPFVLKQLNFQLAKSNILPTSFDELDELVDYMISQPELNLIIIGHTDNLGRDKMNISLSNERAHAVAKYLIAKGIESMRLAWKGFGSKQPIADNATEEGRRKNRRVELQFK